MNHPHAILARVARASVVFAFTVIATQNTPAQETTIPAATLAKFDSLSATLKPATRSWVLEQAIKANKIIGTASTIESSIRSSISVQFPKSIATDADRMTLLYLVVRESIQQNQDDKKFYLEQLKSLNETARALGDLWAELTAASAAHAAKEKAARDSAACKLPACLQFKSRHDSLLVRYRAVGLTTIPRAAIKDGNDLADRIRRLEAEQEELRNKRTQVTTAFESQAQKSDQYFAMLTSVLKTLAELRSIGASSRSGL